MATCHSLTLVNGKLLGYPIDVKMFESINWKLLEPEPDDTTIFQKVPPRIVHPAESNKHEKSQIAIFRQFPFESLQQRMTVLTRKADSDQFEVYVKGAPEMISVLCNQSTIPDDFKDILEVYTRQGYRVLAVAWKKLPITIRWDDIVHMPRETLECEMEFSGLIVLQNRLKPESQPALEILKDALIRTVMVTGDNLFTAISIARDCGMIEENDSVIQVEAELNSSSNGEQCLHVYYSYAKLPGYSEKLNVSQNGGLNEISIPLLQKGQYHLAAEGKTFHLIKVHDARLLERIALKGTIFARMLPEQKLHLIEVLQGLGHQVGMCGDGANDCGALKAAHAGVSLSIAEASVASPFTSTKQNIQCIPTLIREGRAALSATFGSVRYMVCYCFVLLAAVLLLFWDGQKPSDEAYVLIDVILTIIPPIIFGSTEAYPYLVKRIPVRSILSFLPQFSMVSFILLQIGFYVLMWYFCTSQPWYEPFIYDKEKTHSPYPSHMVTAVLSMNMMSYVIAAVIFSPGPPYRKSFLSNKVYVTVVVVEFLLVSWLILYPPDLIANMLNFRAAPHIEYHFLLYGICLANFVTSYLWEVFFIQGLLFEHVMPILRRLRGPIHPHEKLERELSKSKWPPIGKSDGYTSLSAKNSKRFSYAADENEVTITKLSSVSNRHWWSKHRNSLHVGFRHSNSAGPEGLVMSQRDPVAFVTFQDGTHKLLCTEEPNGKHLVQDSVA